MGPDDFKERCRHPLAGEAGHRKIHADAGFDVPCQGQVGFWSCHVADRGIQRESRHVFALLVDLQRFQPARRRKDDGVAAAALEAGAWLQRVLAVGRLHVRQRDLSWRNRQGIQAIVHERA